MENTKNKGFGERLTETMRIRGYAPYDVAKKLKVSMWAVQDWKDGVMPQPCNLTALADMLGVSRSYLVGGALDKQTMDTRSRTLRMYKTDEFLHEIYRRAAIDPMRRKQDA